MNTVLFNARQKKGYSQRTLGALLRTTQTSIRRWESGECLPNASKLKALSVALNISMDEIIGGFFAKEPDASVRNRQSNARRTKGTPDRR